MAWLSEMEKAGNLILSHSVEDVLHGAYPYYALSIQDHRHWHIAGSCLCSEFQCVLLLAPVGHVNSDPMEGRDTEPDCACIRVGPGCLLVNRTLDIPLPSRATPPDEPDEPHRDQLIQNTSTHLLQFSSSFSNGSCTIRVQAAWLTPASKCRCPLHPSWAFQAVGAF